MHPKIKKFDVFGFRAFNCSCTIPEIGTFLGLSQEGPSNINVIAVLIAVPPPFLKRCNVTNI